VPIRLLDINDGYLPSLFLCSNYMVNRG